MVLLEVTGLHVVLAQGGLAAIGLLHAHHQAQQGGFAGPIGSHKGNPIAPFHLQFGAKKQDLIAIAVAEVVDLSHQASGPGGVGKAKPGPAHGFNRSFQPIDFVEQLFAALGLG